MTNREFLAYHDAWNTQKNDDEYRENYRLATLMAHIANCNSDKKSKKFKASDFIKSKNKEKQKMDINMMVEVLKAITLASGGTVEGV